MSGQAQSTPWRLVLLAFAVWAANFILGYAAALLAPDSDPVRMTLIGLAVSSAVPFVWIARHAPESSYRLMVQLAVGIAATATLFNAFAAFA